MGNCYSDNSINKNVSFEDNTQRFIELKINIINENNIHSYDILLPIHFTMIQIKEYLIKELYYCISFYKDSLETIPRKYYKIPFHNMDCLTFKINDICYNDEQTLEQIIKQEVKTNVLKLDVHNKFDNLLSLLKIIKENNILPVNPHDKKFVSNVNDYITFFEDDGYVPDCFDYINLFQPIHLNISNCKFNTNFKLIYSSTLNTYN